MKLQLSEVLSVTQSLRNCVFAKQFLWRIWVTSILLEYLTSMGKIPAFPFTYFYSITKTYAISGFTVPCVNFFPYLLEVLGIIQSKVSLRMKPLSLGVHRMLFYIEKRFLLNRMLITFDLNISHFQDFMHCAHKLLSHFQRFTVSNVFTWTQCKDALRYIQALGSISDWQDY